MTSPRLTRTPSGPTLKDTLRWAIDAEVGIVKRVSVLTLQPGEPDLFVAIAEFQDPSLIAPKNSRSERKFYGSGAGLTKEAAIWATFGEAIERYAGSVYFEDELIEARYSDVADRALDPRELIAFSDEQYARPGFQFVRYDPEAKRRWVEGFDVTNKRNILVPAATAILGYAAKDRAEALDNSYSTGLSASNDYTVAATSAIREVLERDAFTCHWYTKTAPARVDVRMFEKVLSEGAQRLLRHPGLAVNLLDITNELGVPTLLCLLTRDHGPGVAVGACCHLEASAAAEKAVIEAYHCLSWILDLERSGMGALELENVRNFEDHTRYYLDPRHFPNLEFLLEGPESHLSAGEIPSVPKRDPASELMILLDVVRKAGHRVILVDMTPDDVRQLGLVVVRAIIPGLQPLSCGPGREHLDPRRLQAFCSARGRSLPSPLNLDLHPFP